MNIVVIGWRRHNTIVQRRPETGHWEYPGGKMEPWETPYDALIREYKEEVDVDIRPVRLLDYQIRTLTIGVTLLMLFEVVGEGDPKSCEGQEVAIYEQVWDWNVQGPDGRSDSTGN